MTGTKYIIVAALDQQVGFVTSDGSFSTERRCARFFDTKEEADAANIFLPEDTVEEVADVAAFLSKEEE